MDRSTAYKIHELMVKTTDDLAASVTELRSELSDEEFLSYRRSIANVMGEIITEVMYPVYKIYPLLEQYGVSGTAIIEGEETYIIAVVKAAMFDNDKGWFARVVISPNMEDGECVFGASEAKAKENGKARMHELLKKWDFKEHKPYSKPLQ